jgi:hypothetical protein
MTILKKIINKILWYLNQFGIDPLKFLSASLGFFPYCRDFIKYKIENRNNPVPIEFKPCLADRFTFAASLDFEYFYQDLHVARLVYARKPEFHYDVGSRIDGFVSQISLFTKVFVFDIRPLDIAVQNINFYQKDLALETISQELISSTASLSCLHTLEHLGLGRYGDPIRKSALKNFIKNLSLMLRESGVLYVSFPVGRRRVEFNANNIFNLTEMNLLFREFNLLPLGFYLYRNREIKDCSDLIVGAELHYDDISDGLAIIELKKTSHQKC